MVFSDPIFGFLPASLVIFHLLRIYVGGTPAVWALKPPLLNYVMFILFFPQLIARRIALHQEMGKQVFALRAGKGSGLEWFVSRAGPRA